jgi:hypothetical protein
MDGQDRQDKNQKSTAFIRVEEKARHVAFSSRSAKILMVSNCRGSGRKEPKPNSFAACGSPMFVESPVSGG